MNQTTQHDLIGIADVAAKIPGFIAKVPSLLSGLKQAYLRTPNTPAGLGIAFDRPRQNRRNGSAAEYFANRQSAGAQHQSGQPDCSDCRRRMPPGYR